MKQRIVVGLSGGVDSAVTAWLLKRAGHEVVGIFMKNWEGKEGESDDEHCTSRQDFLDAASVADVIGIELEHVNFSAEYRDRVFAEFLREYRAGRTPNPDVLCNAEIKFKAFLDHAVRLGAAHIATGHYARVREAAPGRFQLLKGVDPDKDQSYFLHRLSQPQLARAMFPLGEMHKTEVRRLAAEIGLPNAAKKDSTGICFIGERPFRAFLQQWLANEPGPMRDEHGRTVGEHVGLSFYTIGQRKGIGIGGVKPRPGEVDASAHEHAPWFVAAKDVERNVLTVVRGRDHPLLQARGVAASNPSWVGPAPSQGQRLAAKLRHRQPDAMCTLESIEADGRLRLAFDAPQWGIAPGQSAVLYAAADASDDAHAECLGGAVIDSAFDPDPAPARTATIAAMAAIG